MSDEIRPALSAEEWERVHMRDGAAVIALRWADGDMREMYVPTYHRIAALCLHAQPFGFTNDDLETILEIILDGGFYDGSGERLESIAARIAALLPPQS